MLDSRLHRMALALGLGLGLGCGDGGGRTGSPATFTPTASAGMDGSGTQASPDDDGGPGPDDDGGTESVTDDTGPCTPGAEGCACFGGGACEAGLDCIAEVCVPTATCPNGRVEEGEDCDDGNAMPGDGCEADCTFTPGAAAITAAGNHTCVLVVGGTVRCWGNGANGRLGYGDVASIGDDEPPSVAGDVDVGGPVMAISAGTAHTCALLEGGTVRCWGNGADGRLGYGSIDDVGDDESPASVGDVPLGSAAMAIEAGGSHTCAILDDGSVRCWGAPGSGKLGVPGSGAIGDDEPASAAAVVQLGGAAAALDVGINHACVARADGAALCWGSGSFGRLGHGGTDNVGDDETPASVGPIDLGGATVSTVAAGASHSCVLTDGGDARCFGFADFGQLGYGDTVEIGDDEAPIGAVMLGGAVAEVRAGNDHGCALTDAGKVLCWGRGNSGQLGLASTEDIGDDEVPVAAGTVDVGGLADAIAVGQSHSCALLQGGTVRCWGAATEGQLGTGATTAIGDDETPASAPVVDFL